MKILNGHSLAGNGWIRPDSMGLNLEERNSTATVSMALDGAEGLAVGQWLQDDREPGDGIVWRIRTMDRQYDRNTVTITLEHAIQTLKDRILFGDVTAAMMSGTAGASTCTARQAVAYILAQQGDWVLGDFDFDGVSNPYKFNGETLMDALETVSNSLTDPLWEYDFSAYPFVLHIRQMGSGVGSEMRMSRNISSLRLTIDRSGMYTRFYPIGKNNLKLAGGYVSRNEAVWGIVSKVETDQSKTSAAELTAWANERLNRHAEPLITGTISGMDYSERTGESLDRLAIGQKCRVPLPEYGTTITERITRLSWRDKIGQKEAVTVTLANKRQDVATILKEQAASGGRGGRAGAKNAEEDHAWFVDTTEKVAMVAEAVAGEDSQGNPNWSRVAQLTVDGSGIDARVTYAEGEIVTHATRITQTENAITAEVTRATGAEGTLSSRITQTADAITAEVTRATGAESGLSGRIDVEAGRIGLVVEGSGSGATVKRASIIAAVTDNNGQLDSSITMAADNVIIGSGDSSRSVTVVVNGKLTTSDLSSSIANLGLVEVQRLSTTNDIAAGSLYGQNIYISGATAQASPFSVKNFIKAIQVVAAEGNTYKLQYQTHAGGETWTDANPGTFSRATSLSGKWSGNQLTVTASPQGNTYTESVSIDFDGNGADNFSAVAKDKSGTARKSEYIYLVASGTGSGAQINACKASDGTGVVGSFPVSNIFDAVTRYKGDGSRLASVTRYKGNGVRLKTATYYPGDGTRLGSSGTYYKGNGTRLASVTRYKGNGTRLKTATYYPGDGTRLGDKETYYKGNGSRLASVTRYKGNGSSVTGRGSSVSRKYKGTLYDMSSGTPASKGTGSWFLVDDQSVTTVYRGNGSSVTGRGDSESVYALDNTGSYYLRGDSVAAYPESSSGSNYLRGTGASVYVADNSGSYYLRGDSEAVYASDNTGSYYLRGDSVAAYPEDNTGSNYLRGTGASVYVADNSGSYYLRGDSEAVYALDNTGTYYLRGAAETVLIDKPTPTE